MDEMCNKLEVKDSNKATANAEMVESVIRCGSPVFKCVNQTKPIRGNNLDSSDYEVPSYQINQSAKSKTSSKHGSETSESVLPFSPIFSPVPVPSTTQFQPPSIHSLGTVTKMLDKLSKNKVNSFLHVNKDPMNSCGLFESLGMNDKDISWVSSMASPPPKRVPGSQFNTVEKATFFPEEKFQSIQPRALFSPNLDDDFGCHPISFCSGSEDGDGGDDGDDAKAYKSNIRLSDVCATLRQLEVKSLDQASDHSAENIILQENSLISPVIKTKKNKTDSVKKRKKGVLVMSPENEHKYEFMVGQTKVRKCEVKSDNGTNFIEDDSFQSMSFSCIDELCKTLVTEGSTSSIIPKSGDCDKNLPDTAINNSKTNIPKIFYDSKATADVYEVSSLNDLHSYAKALEEEDTCISMCSKTDKPFAEKGIIRFDVLSKSIAEADATKHLHSEGSEENDPESEKKFKNVDENTGWEKMKQYMSESQLNVSDGEIFRTVENLEKTLASQDSRDLGKLSEVHEPEGSPCQNLGGSPSSRISSDIAKQEVGAITSECGGDDLETCRMDKGAVPIIYFTNILGSKISVSKRALDKAREILRDCDKEVKCKVSLDESGELIEISEKALEKGLPAKRTQDCGGLLTKDFRILEEANATLSDYDTLEVKSEKLDARARVHCIEKSKGNVVEALTGGFMTGSGKQISVSAKALERAKAIMSECDEVSEMVGKGTTIRGGFSTSSGKGIEVSAKALEKAKALMEECNEGLKEMLEGGFREGFSTGSGKKIQVSGRALEKAKVLLEDCDEGSEGEHPTSEVLSTDSGKAVPVSEGAFGGAKAPMLNCEQECLGNSNAGATVKTEDIYESFDNCERAKSKAETFREDQKSASFGFSTALGNKVKVSERALEKAKSFWCKSEESVMELSVDLATAVPRELSPVHFSTRGGSTTSESEPVLTTANEGNKGASILEDSGNVGHIEDCVKPAPQNESEGSVLDKVDVSGLDGSEDWDEIIPSWLHVYNTSPSVASEGAEMSSLIVREEGNSSMSGRKYIVRSPVLGIGDRFLGKRKRRKLRFEEEKKLGEKSQRDLGRKGGAKRASGLPIDFSVPFKRVKFVEEAMTANSDVRVGRARKREEQEKVIKEKHKVKPSKGLHLSKKCSEKQMSWKEAVGESLPEMHSDELLKSIGVSEEVLRINVRNAASFTFKGEDFFGPGCEKNIEGIPAGDECVLILDDENKVGVQEFKRAFLASSGVQPNLVADGWVENHFKWIVWKLAHYERSFPRYFAGKCLTPNNVMLQLKYRYDREIDRNERSALKKILERDDTSVRRLVLCVCGIEKTEVSTASKYELSLTDGWYSCPARPDSAMTKLIDEGKLCVGMKLMIQGAVLVNCEEGVAPLEMSSDVHLKISTNSTRRAKWDTKLGFQKDPQNFPVSLSSIVPQGGMISRIDVIIVRVYPVLYMEKTSDGRHVTRNRRSEEKADAEYRRIQEQKMESICNEVQMEMRKEINLENKSKRNCLNNFKQIEDMCELMESSSDPSALQELVTIDQRKLLENFESDESDRLSRELAEKIGKKLEKENLHKRNVSEFFRAKIVDLRKPDYNNPAVLSVWHPNEDLVALLSEGKVISLKNVTISNSSRACKPLQISTTRQTHYIPICRSVKYPARKVTQLKDISSRVCPAFEEVDLVGMVVLVKDISYGSRLSQVVYLTDFKMNFAGIVFWGSCKNYGWENVLRIGCIVACSNLQWKRNYSPQDVPSLYVSENSVFTENPRHSYLKEEMGKLKQNIPPDMSDFLSKCEENLIARLEESKWRENCNRNSSANGANPRGTQSNKCRANGFESKPAASSTPIKPFTSRISPEESEPSPIQKRIESLQAYGEPPSLIPLIIKNNGKRKFRKKSSVTRTCQ